jgi:hypothetical protein
MPPITTMPIRVRQRELSRWRPYGPPTSFTIQVPNQINHPSPFSEKPSVRHSLKLHAPRPLQYKNNNRRPVTRTSPTPPRTTDYACSTSTVSSEPLYSILRLPTPVSLTDEVSDQVSLCSRVPPTDNEDLPPLPELRTEKPVLACANTPAAKELVGVSIVRSSPSRAWLLITVPKLDV